jgi:hypothetical protein
MALTDIVTSFGQSPVLDFSRGNVGTVLDAVSRTNEFVTPVITNEGGGGGSEEIILNVTKGKLLKRMTDKLYFDL